MECGVRSVEWKVVESVRVWSVECKLRSVERRVWSVECKM